MENKGTLYLIPNLLGGENTEIIAPQVQEVVSKLDIYIVENLRNARRYLIKLGIKDMGKTIDGLTFHHMDKHEEKRSFIQFLKEAEEGHDIGLISDAGCPAVADPGTIVVKAAHKKGITVVPLVGPSSILLALMASGLNGQSFAFNGYLPVKRGDRIKRLRQLEKEGTKYGQTQIFIEAPYRNNPLLKDIMGSCQSETKLCIAVDISLPTQQITTKTIEEWKKELPELHKRPAVFLLGR